MSVSSAVISYAKTIGQMGAIGVVVGGVELLCGVSMQSSVITTLAVTALSTGSLWLGRKLVLRLLSFGINDLLDNVLQPKKPFC